ncbi:MAG: MoaD/ThiS family protein [Bacteroidota bacterium]
MKVTVKLFSLAKDLAGFDEREFELTQPGVAADVVQRLIRENSRFLEWKNSLRLAVNCEYVNGDHLLKEGDEVAVIPPVSGG